MIDVLSVLDKAQVSAWQAVRALKVDGLADPSVSLKRFFVQPGAFLGAECWRAITDAVGIGLRGSSFVVIP